MKTKSFPLIPVFLVLLAIIITFTGCGSGKAWNEIPIYPGATMIHETMETRAYNSSDSYQAVVKFYQEEMLNEGWFEYNIDEHEDTQTHRSTWEGQYGKNNPDSAATVNILQTSNNETTVMLAYFPRYS
jgi:hypothetical protein